MPFENIKNLTGTKVKENHYYFLDANVWIYAMNTTCMPNAKDKGNSIYSNFFFEITDSAFKPRPRIIMSSLLMSEIINTYLRKFALPDYIYKTYTSKGGHLPSNFDYKKDYRNKANSDHFAKQYELIRNEIKTYHESIEVVDDSFIELKPFQLLKSCPTSQDFNDYYYYMLCKKLTKKYANFSFVTNDGDFKINDFEILTTSTSLLELNKS